jgi:large subunit ribosomal protein L22
MAENKTFPGNEKKTDQKKNFPSNQKKEEAKVPVTTPNVTKKEEAKVPATPTTSAAVPATQTSDAKDKKPEAKKEKVVERPKKEEAIAKGANIHASKKHCMYICDFIKNKPIDLAILQLGEIIKMKRAIPFKGEIPHRHELGGKPGRYPVNASKEFIFILKALKGNAIVNGLDIDKTKIYLASATWASRPSRRGGTRFKRAFVLLKAKEFPIGEVKK